MRRLRAAVLISGRGSNLRALIEAARAEDYPAEVSVVISNRADAPGLSLAENQGIPARLLDRKSYPSRQTFETALDMALRELRIDLVALAGFMQVLSPVFVDAWKGRIVNIHPSLLPDYRGLNTHERALADGASVHGCTVHHVTSELDAGPVIMKASVPILEGDTPETLAKRVLQEEHRLYPKALASLAGQLSPKLPR